MVGTIINLWFIMLFTQCVSSGQFLDKNVCMQNEVVLRCPYKQSIGITNILYHSKWNVFGWKSFNPIFCTAWTHTWNDCKSSISYKHLQDQCMWEDTCIVVMDYNPCWSETLLYATIYYKCIGYALLFLLHNFNKNGKNRYKRYNFRNVKNHTDSHNQFAEDDIIKMFDLFYEQHILDLGGYIFQQAVDTRYEPVVPYPLIKYYGNRVPPTTSTQNPDKSSTYLHHKKDNDDDDGDDNDNESQSSKSLKIGLGIALGITSIIAVIALICILISRRQKREQRPSPTPCSNHLTYDNENPSAYQISASNPGYSQRMPDSVDRASDSSYALPSYEEAVGNVYEEVNYRTSRATKGPQ